MSSTERNTQARTSSAAETADETAEVETARAASTPVAGQADGESIHAEEPSKPTASSMRDAAMARVASRQDLSSRRSAAARTSGAAAGGSAAAAAGRSDAEGGAASSAQRANPRKRRRTGPRRVRLTIQRIDPWSVFKISLLVAVGLGIAMVVAVAVLWTVLSGMNVFNTINDFIVQVTSGEDGASQFDLMQYIGLGRVLSLTVVFAVANVLLLTALATLSAFLYNVCSALVGGAHLTLSDE